METNQQTQQATLDRYIPPSLAEQTGTYAGETDLIGKRIVITKESPNPIIKLLGMPNVRLGAEGTIVHVDEDGYIYADFGDDERADVRGEEDGHSFRIYDIGHVNGETEDAAKLYELIN